ncbi:YheC/YheD family protein [Bacillus shivajii]|uniref:YheC/YheD family protein n=1 Tax=Bacillus shivajii TaxID=1983719 RepID=UPI001CFC1759|nr:YheC/YheD family protein [Bacillus shivajii]UCZ52468.1 YheC/YheD family protein [Bacillus shivajii]
MAAPSDTLDQNGHFGDIAIDFILDIDLHVWILEINKRYGYKSFSILEEPELFNEIIRNPFHYARALCGFSNEEVLEDDGIKNEIEKEEAVQKLMTVLNKINCMKSIESKDSPIKEHQSKGN